MLSNLMTRRLGAMLGAGAALFLALGSTHAAAQGAARPAPPPAAGAVSPASPANLDSLLERANRGRVKGAENARVTIIEVSDFECPYCRAFFDSTYARLDSAYVRTGKVKIVFFAFPLPGHREAFPAAKAAMCASVQGKFWPMHDRLFSTQREWANQDVVAERFAGYAAALRLDMPAYRDCVANDRVAPLILNDIMQGSAAGISGTPTFILNGQKALNGAVPFDDLKKEIDAILAAPPAPPAGTPPPAGARPPAGTPPAAPAATPPPVGLRR
ncbi:MAG: oxidoreductase [Gemmatimonadetes bacterium]|nr:oxidoreductase [Gemmatimonadota bacterium]